MVRVKFRVQEDACALTGVVHSYGGAGFAGADVRHLFHQQDDGEINDGDNRSRKVWLLLAYMIYCLQPFHLSRGADRPALEQRRAQL